MQINRDNSQKALAAARAFFCFRYAGMGRKWLTWGAAVIKYEE